MLLLAILAILAGIAAGLATKIVLDFFKNEFEISWLEFTIGAVLIAILIVPLTTWAGWSIAKSNQLSFNEYWNGFEKAATWERTPCSRDGPCVHEYDCDPWIHIHVETHTDSEGHTTTTTYPHTHYHSCPYTTEEWTFSVDTTLGFYTIGDHWLPTDPKSHRFRANHSVPDNIPSGIPAFWSKAKARVDNGKPGPVTKRMQYDNYILASDNSILKQYSDKIKQFLDAGLLPKVTHDVHDFFYADKVYFVGFTPENPEAWQSAVMYLNAALGTELQGDLHLVIAQDSRILREPDAYITALKAYWTNTKVFDDNAVSKNAIIVVVATQDHKTISWARAVTGMPLGNEAMLVAIQNGLKGIPLTPDAVVGDVNGEFYTKEYENGEKKLKIRGIHGNGALEKILWGLDYPSTKFSRISMTGKDKDDLGGGFLYLDSEIQPSSWQKFWIVFVGFFLSLLVWLTFVFIGKRYIPGFTRRDPW